MALAIVPRPSINPETLALAAEIEDAEGLGHKAALVLADLYRDELLAYATAWDQAARPRCPQCGAPIESRQAYVGGRGYLFFEVCSGDGGHYSRLA